MIQLVPQLRILLACEPVDFRRGIDSLAAVCRTQFDENPMSGSVFVFRNRAGTALKLLTYDGGGYWLCLRRLSTGKIRWWPQAGQLLHPLQARELAVLLYNGLPDRADFTQDWKRIDHVVFNQAARNSTSSSTSRG
jgi:transposase